MSKNQPDGQTLFSDIPYVNVDATGITYLSWALPPLYRTNKGGKWLIWQVMFNGDTRRLITLHGQVGGNLIHNEKQVVLNKSRRNINNQAILEASSRYKKKLDGGYLSYQDLIPSTQQLQQLPQNLVQKVYPDVQPGEMQLFQELVQGFHQNLQKQSQLQIKPLPKFEVMLSEEYNPSRVIHWPVSGEPKFDGIRSYSKPDPTASMGIALKSRNHKDFPWSNHIRSQLAVFFRYLPEGSILDGELYNHYMTFEQISSAVRRAKTMNPNNAQLKYYIFDIFEPNQLVFEDRYNLLVAAHNRFISDGNDSSALVIVPMTMLFSDDEVKLAEITFSTQGFEGVIVRQFAGSCTGEVSAVEYTEPTTGLILPIRFCEMNPSTRTPQSIKLSQYKPKRSYNLMKYKTFKTEEGIVVDIVSGVGKRQDAGIIVLKDMRGNIFNVSPTGSIETHKQWLRNKQKYIGLPYTFKYQELSEYNIPRFPVGISFRDYE